MNKRATVSADGAAITVHIPMTFRKRGGRKTVVTPDGAPWAPRPRVDNALVRALARAFRWRKMLDDGVCGTIEELARREKVNRGYMSRVLRLTLLAPEIVEAIDGRQPAGMRLEDLLELGGAEAGVDAAGRVRRDLVSWVQTTAPGPKLPSRRAEDHVRT